MTRQGLSNQVELSLKVAAVGFSQHIRDNLNSLNVTFTKLYVLKWLIKDNKIGRFYYLT